MYVDVAEPVEQNEEELGSIADDDEIPESEEEITQSRDPIAPSEEVVDLEEDE